MDSDDYNMLNDRLVDIEMAIERCAEDGVCCVFDGDIESDIDRIASATERIAKSLENIEESIKGKNK